MFFHLLQIVDTVGVLFLVALKVWSFKHPVEAPAQPAAEPLVVVAEPAPVIVEERKLSNTPVRTDLVQVVTFPDGNHVGWVQHDSDAYHVAYNRVGHAVIRHGEELDPGVQE